MESTAKCLTATMSVAWRREAEAGTLPQAADWLAGVVCVMEMETAVVVVVDHELRPADWRSEERGDDGGRAQSGGAV